MFPSLNQIYRENSSTLIRITARNKEAIFRPLTGFISSVLNDPYFIQRVFDDRSLNLSSSAFVKITAIIEECARELLDEMLLVVLQGVFDNKVLYTLVCACISIAVKLIGAYDWIYDSAIFPSLIEEAKAHGKSVDVRKLNLMEKDILSKTGWKGCSSIADLDRIYDELFNEKVFELVAKDKWFLLDKDSNQYDNLAFKALNISEATISIKERIIKEVSLSKNLTIDQARDWIKNRVLKVGFGLSAVKLDEIIDTEDLTLIFKDKWYIVTATGDKLDNNTFNQLGIKSATVSLDPKSLRDTMKGRSLTKEKAIKWIKDRVLIYGFELDSVSIKI